MQRVLVTGGAGFIGSHLCDALVKRGCEVMAFDCLDAQVHPKSPEWPSYIDEEKIQTWFGDVRDVSAVFHALSTFKPDTVIHLAAKVGVAQGNEHIASYTSANVTGTAILMHSLVDYNRLVDERAEAEALLDEEIEVTPQLAGYEEVAADAPLAVGDEYRKWTSEAHVTDWSDILPEWVGTDATAHFGEEFDGVEIRRPVMETQEEAEARYEAWRIETTVKLQSMPSVKVGQVFIAGSMSAYGEGAYRCGIQGNASRTRGVLPWCEEGKALPLTTSEPGGAIPVGLLESDDLLPVSVYASNKAEQERLSLIIGKLRGLDVRVGRFFNCYGDRQALSNPYTGVGAIFAARALSGLAPRVYEDGKQTRDFIHVSDLVSGILAILDDGEPGEIYNVGTGIPTEVGKLATLIAQTLDAPAPEFTGQVRAGDIRHAFADATKLRALGWEPKVTIEEGVEALCRWVAEASEVDADLDAAHNDLLRSGLLTGGAE